MSRKNENLISFGKEIIFLLFKMNITRIIKKEWGILVLLILMVPLFFLNMKDCHDWGGDFAQYIHQAINIVKGIPITETGYIFNDQYPFAPPSYPNGFPLMLAPIYAMYGNSIICFSYYITSILFLLGIAIFFFIRKHLGNSIAIAIVLIIVYNPWTLRFKMEILSDIPFTLFLMITIILYEKTKEKAKSFIFPLLLGLLSAWLILIRSVGIILLLAIFADYIILLIRGKICKEKVPVNWSHIVTIFLTFGIVYVIFTKLIFPINSEPLNFYSSAVSLSSIKLTLLRNADYYVQNFQRFFHPDVGIYNIIPLVLKAFALSFFVIGFLFSITKRLGFLEILTILYFIVILLFPNLTQGIRLIFPLFPLLLFYIVEGLKSLKPHNNLNPAFFGVILGIISILQYEPGIQKIIIEKNTILVGPQEPEAQEAFRIISELTPSDAKIAFNKPTVLSLYSERSSLSNHYSQDTKSLGQKLTEKGINFFLLCNDLPNPVLKAYINENQTDIILVWKNSKFEFYKKIDH